MPAYRRIFGQAGPTGIDIERRARRCYARPSFRSSKECPGRVEKPIELTAEGVWTEISGRLREALNENTFSTWFAHVHAARITDDEFVLTVPNNFTREWIEGHFLGLIGAVLAEIAGEHSIRLELAKKPEGAARVDPQPAVQPHTGRDINSKYTFDSFV